MQLQSLLLSDSAPPGYNCATSTCRMVLVRVYCGSEEEGKQERKRRKVGAASCPAQAQMSKSGWDDFGAHHWHPAAPWTSMNPLVPQERRSAQPFARPAQRQRHHPFVLLWIAAQRTFQSSAERFRPSALTQMAPGHRESIRARHTVTLRISWSSFWFWSAATRKKGEKEAHDGSVNVWWPPCVHSL